MNYWKSKRLGKGKQDKNDRQNFACILVALQQRPPELFRTEKSPRKIYSMVYCDPRTVLFSRGELASGK